MVVKEIHAISLFRQSHQSDRGVNFYQQPVILHQHGKPVSFYQPKLKAIVTEP